MSNPSKQKGTRFETALVDYLRRHGIPAERKALHGKADEGDIRAEIGGRELCIEAKDRKRLAVAEWADELAREKALTRADHGVLVIHRAGMGRDNFGRNLAVMELADLLELIGGAR